MENKDLEKMFNIRLTKRCCENCYFNQEGICKFNNELIKESKECDYFIDKKMVLEQMINNAMEIKKIKNMIENPDFQKKMDVFIEKNQELKEQKSLEEHAKKLEENYQTILDAIIKAKPATAKGQYIKSISISTTMGPGLFIE